MIQNKKRNVVNVFSYPQPGEFPPLIFTSVRAFHRYGIPRWVRLRAEESPPCAPAFRNKRQTTPRSATPPPLFIRRRSHHAGIVDTWRRKPPSSEYFPYVELPSPNCYPPFCLTINRVGILCEACQPIQHCQYNHVTTLLTRRCGPLPKDHETIARYFIGFDGS